MKFTALLKILVACALGIASIYQVEEAVAEELEIGAFKTNFYGSFVRLREPSKWGESITVYLFKKRLFSRSIQGIKRGNVGTAKSFIARIGQAPVLTLNIALKPGSTKCSKENLTAMVALFQQGPDMPLGLTTENLVNIDLRKKNEDPKKPVVTSFSCELKEGSEFSLSIKTEFLFPSSEEYIDTLIEDGDEALTVKFDFSVNSSLEKTK